MLAAHLYEAAHRNSRFSPANGEEPMSDYRSLPADLPVPEDDGALPNCAGRECRRWTSMPPTAPQSALRRWMRADLASGAWHRRHADLLERDSVDYGYRLLIAGR